MHKPLSDRLNAIPTKRNGTATYAKATRKRNDEEACLREAESSSTMQGIYENITLRFPHSMQRRIFDRLGAEIDAPIDAKFTFNAETKAAVAARENNHEAWISNLKCKKAGDDLAPFVTTQGEEIDGFPETPMGILLLDDESLGSLLRKLGLGGSASKAQMAWQLANHIGIGTSMRPFFEYHLGGGCETLSMTSLLTSLDEEPDLKGIRKRSREEGNADSEVRGSSSTVLEAGVQRYRDVPADSASWRPPPWVEAAASSSTDGARGSRVGAGALATYLRASAEVLEDGRLRSPYLHFPDFDDGWDGE